MFQIVHQNVKITLSLHICSNRRTSPIPLAYIWILQDDRQPFPFPLAELLSISPSISNKLRKLLRWHTFLHPRQKIIRNYIGLSDRIEKTS